MQKRILFACFLGVLPIVSFATVHPVVTLSSGFSDANVYSTKSIMFGPYPNSYVGSNHSDTQADTGLFIGGEAEFLQDWAWQLGVSYFKNSAFIENGNVYEFADPAFNNLTYQYKIQSQRVSVDTKISHAFRDVWHPYISASLGEAFNSAYSYAEYPVTTADVAMTQPFGNHSTRSFTYSVGLGFDYNLTNHVRLGAGYRFVSFGNARLGSSPLQSGNNIISNNHMYTNELLAQLSYVG